MQNGVIDTDDLRDAVCCAGVEWKQKLESQRGAVLAIELKNNANKLAKWTASALLAGADYIQLGCAFHGV